MSRKSWALFLVISFCLLILVSALVLAYATAAGRALTASFVEEGLRRQGSYELATEGTFDSLLQLAMLLTADMHVRDLLAGGGKAVEAEGGGGGRATGRRRARPAIRRRPARLGNAGASPWLAGDAIPCRAADHQFSARP